MKCYLHPDAEGVGTCTSCGKVVCSQCAMEINGKLVCKQCADKPASQSVPAQAPARKEPILALILSLIGSFITGGILLGLGQIYNGQIKKGIAICLISTLSWVIVIILIVACLILGLFTMGLGLVCCLPVMLLPLAFWLWALYDAYMTAVKINNGEPVKDWFS